MKVAHINPQANNLAVSSTHNMGELQLSGKSSDSVWWESMPPPSLWPLTHPVTGWQQLSCPTNLKNHRSQQPHHSRHNIIHLIIIFSAWLVDSVLTPRQTISAYQNKGQQSEIPPLCLLLPLTWPHLLYHLLNTYSPWPPFSILLKSSSLYLQAFAIINVSWGAVEILWVWLIFLCLRIIDACEKPARFHSLSESGWKIEH